MNILIVKFGALGDVVRTAYILKGLLEKYREAKIDWLTSSPSADLLRFNPFISTVVTPNCGFDTIRAKRYDLCISLDDEKEILEMIEDLDIKKIVGAYLDGNQPTYSPDSALWFDMGLLSKYGKAEADRLKKENRLEHNEIMERILGIEIKEPFFYNSSYLEEKAKSVFDDRFFNIGLNSGSGGRWQSKQLSLEKSIALIGQLLELKIGGKETKIYLFGGLEEQERHREITNAFKTQSVVDTGNANTILEFAALIKGCDYLISSDSLALHLGISQGVKNLSFFAPTSAAEIGTFGKGVKVISSADDYCSYKKDCDTSSVSVERILETFKHHLQI